MSDADLVKLVAALGAGEVRENYIVPGLRSTLLAHPAAGGIVRLFEMTREQEYDVTAHDHRYNFQCCVLAGSVENRRYRTQSTAQGYATHAALPYDAKEHALDDSRPRWLYASHVDEVHGEGDWYGMSADEFHSIRFSKGAKVLLIEGPQEKDESWCLLPYANGRICNTFIWRDWMMARAI